MRKLKANKVLSRPPGHVAHEEGSMGGASTIISELLAKE